jgi:hypothetical protein
MKKAAVWLALVLLPVRAMAEDLNEFLTAATAANRPDVPLRADGTITVRSPDATVEDKVVIVMQTNGDTYIETKRGGVKALLKPAQKEVYLRAGRDSAEKKVALEDSFPGTDLSWEDLVPFDVSSWDFPVIIDKSAQQLTVQLTPKTQQYILVVSTFDREKRVPFKTLYYVEKASNLVKMRTDEDLVQVADQWLPRRISMQTFALRTATTLALEWRKATDVPEGLFLSGSLERDSGLRFVE